MKHIFIDFSRAMIYNSVIDKRKYGHEKIFYE